MLIYASLWKLQTSSLWLDKWFWFYYFKKTVNRRSRSSETTRLWPLKEVSSVGNQRCVTHTSCSVPMKKKKKKASSMPHRWLEESEAASLQSTVKILWYLFSKLSFILTDVGQRNEEALSALEQKHGNPRGETCLYQWADKWYRLCSLCLCNNCCCSRWLHFYCTVNCFNVLCTPPR